MSKKSPHANSVDRKIKELAERVDVLEAEQCTLRQAVVDANALARLAVEDAKQARMMTNLVRADALHAKSAADAAIAKMELLVNPVTIVHSATIKADAVSWPKIRGN